jgi:RNA polymerase sigma-70 factor, ECF subfamily
MTDTARVRPAEADLDLDQYRAELTGYCYRMLGSGFDAEDAVQETLVRAWRSFDGFEGRAALRSWLYRIATNVCLDMLNGRQRRARPMDLTTSRRGDSPTGTPLPEQNWIQPIPDGRLQPSSGDPAELAVSRETVRLAFVAALQLLTPRQRAVLILRDVLRWPAADVAALLDTTVVSVKSALQRARSTLAASQLTADDPSKVGDETQQALLVRYIDAFERYDIESLVSLLHDDAIVSMPPYELWLRGQVDIRLFFLAKQSSVPGSRLIPVSANRGPAFGFYKPQRPGGIPEAFGIQLIEVSDDRISGMHTFVDPNLFRLFDLPPRLDC